MAGDDRRLVYSTDGSMPLPAFREPSRAKMAPVRTVPDDGIVRVGCERRRGGWMTLIYNLPPKQTGVIAKEMKRRCGTGGTLKGGVAELQGDHRDTVIAYLMEHGLKTKKMGG